MLHMFQKYTKNIPQHFQQIPFPEMFTCLEHSRPHNVWILSSPFRSKRRVSRCCPTCWAHRSRLWRWTATLVALRGWWLLSGSYPNIPWWNQENDSNTGWWFQPIWNILVKLEIFPKIGGENKNYLKPPPRICLTSWNSKPTKWFKIISTHGETNKMIQNSNMFETSWNSKYLNL